MLGGDESTQVTAGIAGFLVLFFLALACFVLFRSMNGHLRRMRFEQREEDYRGRPRTPPQEGDRVVGPPKV